MNLFTVSFFGHKQIEELHAVEKKLEAMITELLRTKEYVQFLVGRDSEFDFLVSSLIRRCKKAIRADNSALVLILPYMTAEYKNNALSFQAYYDEIRIFDVSKKKYFKAVYQARNRYMVDCSHVVIFAVNRSYGGAYQTLRYAAMSKKPSINLLPFPPLFPENNIQ